MSDRYPGGLIRKTPPTITPPVDGEGGSAPGIWTLEQASYYQGTGEWPKPVLPRVLYGWGQNSAGQLGTGDLILYSSPIQVNSSTDWASLGAGSTTTGIKTDGSLWIWGYDNWGQTGQNAEDISLSSPTQVGALTNWVQAQCRNIQTGAIKTDGTLWTWGNSSTGRTGHNNTIALSSPVQVGALTDWAYVDLHNVSVGLKVDGTVWCWGTGVFGAMGDNFAINRSSPVQVGSLTTWAVVGNWNSGISAVKTDGTLWSWGNNTDGAIGDDTRINRSSPVQVGALTNWAKVSGGGSRWFAIKTDGTLWANGYNGNVSGGGYLGDNTIIARSSPVQIGSDTDWANVWGGAGFSTLAQKTDGTLWTWGYNASAGQLGNNSLIDTSSPVQLGSETNWIAAANGYMHMVAVRKG